MRPPSAIAMRKSLSGITTIEVMIMMVAVSLVILASYGAKISAFKAYAEVIHRGRAQLYAAETLEQLEAIRLTRLQQDYIKSWDLFLGNKSDGYYALVQTDNLSELSLVPVTEVDEITDEDRSAVLFYDADEDLDGFFSRLERRIFVKSMAADSGKKMVTVSVFWGTPGQYREDGPQQIIVQSLYSDHVGKGFAM